jgi:hypothetical protein
MLFRASELAPSIILYCPGNVVSVLVLHTFAISGHAFLLTLSEIYYFDLLFKLADKRRTE